MQAALAVNGKKGWHWIVSIARLSVKEGKGDHPSRVREETASLMPYARMAKSFFERSKAQQRDLYPNLESGKAEGSYHFFAFLSKRSPIHSQVAGLAEDADPAEDSSSRLSLLFSPEIACTPRKFESNEKGTRCIVHLRFTSASK